MSRPQKKKRRRPGEDLIKEERKERKKERRRGGRRKQTHGITPHVPNLSRLSRNRLLSIAFCELVLGISFNAIVTRLLWVYFRLVAKYGKL